MQPLQEEITESITRELVTACESYGKEKGFSAISVRRDLLYLEPGNTTEDITSEVIKVMDGNKK
jgi:Skp family chaperone for outer membrane proteins